MREVITDREWVDFVEENQVSDEVLEVIALRIKFQQELTLRELAIYQENGYLIEEKLKSIS